MTDIFQMPDNFIGIEDREKLESFGGHTISHGRATRWHWGKDADGDDIFEIYRGGADEVLTARIQRDRQKDAFCARDAAGNMIGSGDLEHIMAKLENFFISLHGEDPGTPA